MIVEVQEYALMANILVQVMKMDEMRLPEMRGRIKRLSCNHAVRVFDHAEVVNEIPLGDLQVREYFMNNHQVLVQLATPEYTFLVAFPEEGRGLLDRSMIIV